MWDTPTTTPAVISPPTARPPLCPLYSTLTIPTSPPPSKYYFITSLLTRFQMRARAQGCEAGVGMYLDILSEPERLQLRSPTVL